jgi:hypothetical protein
MTTASPNRTLKPPTLNARIIEPPFSGSMGFRSCSIIVYLTSFAQKVIRDHHRDGIALQSPRLLVGFGYFLGKAYLTSETGRQSASHQIARALSPSLSLFIIAIGGTPSGFNNIYSSRFGGSVSLQVQQSNLFFGQRLLRRLHSLQ